MKKTNITAGNNYKFKSYKYDNSKKKKIKEYKFITIKRENVDKKILRKFKKFLKHKLKEKADNEIKNYIKNNGFWPDYIKMNLMPPFSYEKENISFKLSSHPDTFEITGKNIYVCFSSINFPWNYLIYLLK